MNNNDVLWSQLIKLGDMMGDGLHLESDGRWIEREYKNVCRQLGILPKKKRVNHSKEINEFMVKRTQDSRCSCNGELKQTRSGSFIARCVVCGKKYRLGKAK